MDFLAHSVGTLRGAKDRWKNLKVQFNENKWIHFKTKVFYILGFDILVFFIGSLNSKKVNT